MSKYYDWLTNKPLSFLIIYMTAMYESVFLYCWFSCDLTNLTLHGKITAVLFMLLFLKKCIYDYFKEKRAVAKLINKDKLATFGFKWLDDNNQTAKGMLDNLLPRQIEKYIEEYK